MGQDDLPVYFSLANTELEVDPNLLFPSSEQYFCHANDKKRPIKRTLNLHPDFTPVT